MLPVHCVPQTESLYSNRIQPTLHVPQPKSADYAKRTGESALDKQGRTLILPLMACNYHMKLTCNSLNLARAKYY